MIKDLGIKTYCDQAAIDYDITELGAESDPQEPL